MNEKETIRIIITGGTFDKHYDEIEGALTFRDSHLPGILRQSRCTIDLHMEVAKMVDSLEMGEEDRKAILESCRQAEEERIIITHGTDTMTETARLIGEEALDKTIVLTGAMIPYSVNGSDAVFNLGCSVSAVQLLPPGVYIAMNGRIFPYDSVEKNRQEGRFEGISLP